MQVNLGEVSFDRLSKLFTSLVAIASVIGLLDVYSLYFELFVHFRFQYLVLSLLFCSIFLLNKELLWAALAFSSAFLNAIFVGPIYLSDSNKIDELTGVEITVFHSNVQSSNPNSELLLKQVSEQSPDILVLQEVNKRWIEDISSLSAEYPHHVVRSREDNFGIAVYSKLPIISSEFLYLGESTVPSIKALIAIDDKNFTLVTSHTLPPISPYYFRARNAQIDAISNLINSTKGPRILVGDLNITPWSAFYKPLTNNSGLVDARKGVGVVPTWPAGFYPMSIPIDHVMVSEDINVVNMYSGKNVGSDHLPLIARLKL
jgi:endonuclease/exonuclease/phosphatase (EEP) superfamily protein YafD